MRHLYFDTETRSTVNIKKFSSTRYAEDPTTDTHCAVWVERGKCWIWIRIVDQWRSEERRPGFMESIITPEAVCPKALNLPLPEIMLHVGREKPSWLPELEDACWWAANGVRFDKQIWAKYGDHPKHGVKDFSALTAALQLPRSVEGIGNCFFGVGKDENGERLIQDFCKPSRGSNIGINGILPIPATRAAEMAVYCARDAMILLAAGPIVMAEWNKHLAAHEDRVVEVDTEVQEFGFPFDTDFAEKLRIVAAKALQASVDEMAVKLTARFGKRGMVSSADLTKIIKSHQKLRAYIQKQWGVKLSSVGRQYLNSIIDNTQKLMEVEAEDDEEPEESGIDIEELEEAGADLGEAFKDPLFHELLQLRLDFSMTTSAKIEAGQRNVAADGRIHHATIYAGAKTLRWAGSGFQPQNLPKGDDNCDVDGWRNYVLKGGEKPVDKKPVPLHKTLSTLVRTLISAGKGRAFYGLDLSGIEARVLLWLAQDWAALEAIDKGIDRYWELAKQLFRLAPDTPAPKKLDDNDPRKALFTSYRQLGKTMILGLGFGMGAVKFLENCTKEGIDLSALGITADYAVNFWRDQNTLIAGTRTGSEYEGHAVRKGGLHKSLEWSIRTALGEKPQRDFDFSSVDIGQLSVGAVTATRNNQRQTDLFLNLPSGRPIIYRNIRFAPGRFNPEKMEIAFDGYRKDQVNTLYCFGARFSQNATQALARDLLAEMMVAVQEAMKEFDCKITLTVHDEIVVEGPANKIEEAMHTAAVIMTTPPKWAPDLPLGSEGAAFKTYRKGNQEGYPTCEAKNGKITKSRSWEAF